MRQFGRRRKLRGLVDELEEVRSEYRAKLESIISGRKAYIPTKGRIAGRHRRRHAKRGKGEDA